MFDNVQSLYKDYLAKPEDVQKLTVGIDIRDQRLPFMFEIMDMVTGAPDATYILPFNPEAYNYDPVFRSAFTLTQGGSFEDKIGLGLPKISLAGTFGYLGTLPAGSNARHINGDKKDAWDLYKEIENMILDFHSRFGTSDGSQVKDPVDPGNLPELRFYNYTDKHFYVVQLHKFRISRSTARRLLYQYDIQMTGLRRLNFPTIEEDTLADMFLTPQIPKELGPWDKIMAGYSTVMAGMDKIVSAVQGIQSDLAVVRTSVIAFRNGVSAVISAPFSLVRGIIQTVDSVLVSVISLQEIPHEFTVQMRELKRDMLQLTFHVDKFNNSDYLKETAMFPPSGTQTEIFSVQLPPGQTLAISMETPETTLFTAGQAEVQNVATREEPIFSNDTIESVAFRTLGDSSSWRRLADLNRLEYPYVATGIKAYSSVLGSGYLVAQVGVNLTVSGIMPKVGEIVLLADEPGKVIAFQDGVVTLEMPLSAEYPISTPITLHERVLSVLQPGEKVKVPGSPQGKSSILTGADSGFDEQLYGTDASLDEAGLRGAHLGDIDTVSGLANLTMQLRHRVNTVQGQLLSHPRYGSYLPKIIGKISTDLWLERALLEAEITVMSDPRIKEVKKLRFLAVNTAIYINASIVPIGKLKAQSISILVA
jgi:hypothetical protein